MEDYGEFGHSEVTTTMSMVLFWKKWYESIGIDITYFDIDYYNPNSIKEKIIRIMFNVFIRYKKNIKIHLKKHIRK